MVVHKEAPVESPELLKAKENIHNQSKCAASNPKLTVTVVGGGSSAHVLVPFLSSAGHRVNLMTSRPEEWSRQVSVELHDMDDKILKTVKGSLHKISSDPSEVIPEANVVILCTPVHQHRDALHRLTPFINQGKEEAFIGTIYGQGGFNWMCHEIEQKMNLHNIACFAVGLIPWMCHTIKYGGIGVNHGCKQNNVVAVTPADVFDQLNKLVLNDMCHNIHGLGKFLQAGSFLSLTLSVDNQIIHPSRCCRLWQRHGGKWPTEQDIPFFCGDFDEILASILKQLDADCSKVRDTIRNRFPQRSFDHMLDCLALERFSHGSANVDIQTSFQDSQQLGLIKTPCVKLETGEHALNKQSRFSTDDIPCGLLIAKWIAEKLDVDTPFLDEVIAWAQNLRGWEFLKNGKADENMSLKDPHTSGVPPACGITKIDDILESCDTNNAVFASLPEALLEK